MPAGTPRSYDPRATVAGLEGELRRLEAQAEISWPAELQALRRAGLTDGITVLDAGCGSGAITSRLAQALPDARIVALDSDADLLAHARQRLEVHGKRVQVIEGDLHDPPPAARGADFALTRLVLQHLRDPVGAVRALSATIAPGGTFAAIDVDGGLWGLAEPFFPDLEAIHARAWGSQADRGGNRFVGRRLPRILAAAGLQEPTLELAAVHSDQLGKERFAPLLDPQELQPRVADGTLTLTEYGRLHAAYRRFMEDPEALVLTVSFVAAGRVAR